jgi:hypothetical protein
MGKFLSNLPTRWKAIIAFVGSLATVFLTALADPNIQAMMPKNWQTYLAAGGGALLTAALTALKRNQLTPNQVNTAIVKGDIAPEAVKAVAEKHTGRVVTDVAAETTADLIKKPVGRHRRTPPDEGVPHTPHTPPESHSG